jgi:hypothetical protein
MNQWNQIKTKRKKATPFIVNHSEIDKAVEEYLKNGGKITKLEANAANYASFIKNNDWTSVDEFFFGN